jgi:uncharacterized phiE125 gp8 family phage protein
MPILSQSVAPTVEPLTAAEAKEYLRVDDDGDDTLIGECIEAARVWIENQTRRQLCTATWIQYWDEFPDCNSCPIRLNKSPVQSITSIQYTDTNGDLQTWDSGDYQTDLVSSPARILPAFGETYPATRDQMKSVKITYVAGYGNAAAVPLCVKQAMRWLVGHMYDQRAPVIVGSISKSLELTVQSALDPIRMPEIV